MSLASTPWVHSNVFRELGASVEKQPMQECPIRQLFPLRWYTNGRVGEELVRLKLSNHRR